MNLLKNCIPVSQLLSACDKPKSTVYRDLKHLSFKRGGLRVIRKSDIPSAYLSCINNCMDLSTYCPSYELSRAMSTYPDYLSHARLKDKKPIEVKKVGRVSMVKLTKEFVELAQQGMEPYRLTEDDDETDFEAVIDFYGIKIGFWK